jgi:hypothetical protein
MRRWRGFIRIPDGGRAGRGRPGQPTRPAEAPAGRAEALGAEILQFSALQAAEPAGLATRWQLADGLSFRCKIPTELAGRAVELAARLLDLRRDERRELEGFEFAEGTSW